MSDEMEKFGNERETKGKVEAYVNMIKAKLTNFDAVKASGQVSPSELKLIEAALAQN